MKHFGPQCFGRYDEEGRYFDEGVRTSKGQELRAKALDLLQPSFSAQLGFLREASLQLVTNAMGQKDVADHFADTAVK